MKARLWLGLIAAIAAFGCSSTPADAVRPWNPLIQHSAPANGPQSAARDYAHVVDVRSITEVVSVQWLAPPTNPGYPLWQTLLDDYVVIGITHAVRAADAGAVVAKLDETPEVTDQNGKPLNLLKEAETPPELAKFTAIKSEQVHNTPIPSEMFGPGGVLEPLFKAYQKGFRFFAYANGGVHACTKGGLAINYVGEHYTFETPFPVCGAPAPKPDQNKAN